MMTEQIGLIGCGWLGRPLAYRLCDNGYSVIGTTTQTSNCSIFQEKGIKVVYLKLPCPQNKLPLFITHSPILIITIPFKRTYQDPSIYLEQHQQLLASTKATQRIIITSSTMVYPNHIEHAHEACVLEPHSLRAKVQLEVESLWLTNRRATVLRLGGLYGGDRVLGRFLSGKVPQRTGPVNLIHQEDAVGLIQSIITKGCWNTIINGVSDEHPTREDLYRLKAREMGLPEPCFDSAQTSVKIVSNQKAHEILDYTFKYPSPISSHDLA